MPESWLVNIQQLLHTQTHKWNITKHKYLKEEPHKYTCSQFAKSRGPVGERLVAAIGNQFIVRSSSGLSQTQLCCCQVYKTGFKSVASLSLSADPLLFSTLLYCWFSPRVVWWQARREGGRPTTANCRSSNFSFSQLCIFHTTLCSIFRSALQSIFGPIYSAFSAVAHQEISPRGLNSLQLSPLAHLLLRQN